MPDRITLYQKFKNISKNMIDTQPHELIAHGGTSKIYKICFKKNCVILKDVHVRKNEYRLNNERIIKSSHLIEKTALELTNTLVLNSVCPHFILMYSHYIIHRENDICTQEYPIKSVLINEFTPGITLDLFLENEDDEFVLYNVFFQIVCSLYAMKKHLSMMHIDLHLENIMIQTRKSGGYFEYKIDDKIYYLPNIGYHIVLIDFGHAWIPNIMESWFIRQRFNKKKIKYGYDIFRLLKSINEFEITNFSKNVRKDLNYIKRQELSSDSIYKIFGSKFNKKGKKLLKRYII